MAYTVIPAFGRFLDEGMLIGRLLAGYGEIEFSLLNCISMSGAGLDQSIRGMFGIRGETKRINVAEKIGLPRYRNLNLGAEFSQAISAMRFCLEIRNQYAHCQWHDDNTGDLAFVNLEEITVAPGPISDLTNLTQRHVNVLLLQQQEDFFVHVGEWFDYLNYEGRFLTGKIQSRLVLAPRKIVRPPLHKPS